MLMLVVLLEQDWIILLPDAIAIFSEFKVLSDFHIIVFFK